MLIERLLSQPLSQRQALTEKGVPSCCLQLSGMVQTMVLLVHPGANVNQLWQVTLMMYCFLALAVGFNIFCAQHLPLAEGILLFVHVFAFFVFLLVFWIMGDHAPAERVFTEFYDGGGWGNKGLSCLVGLATPVWCFIGPVSACPRELKTSHC